MSLSTQSRRTWKTSHLVTFTTFVLLVRSVAYVLHCHEEQPCKHANGNARAGLWYYLRPWHSVLTPLVFAAFLHGPTVGATVHQDSSLTWCS